jgi:hypothetical protein
MNHAVSIAKFVRNVFAVLNESEPTKTGQLGKGRETMKKVLAVTLVVMAMMAGGLAQSAKRPVADTNVETFMTQAAAQPASNQKTSAALAGATASTAGYFPVFTDGSGDLGNSALYQLNAGTAASPVWNLGFGTTTPAFNLNFVSQTDPAAIAIDGYGTVGINFIGRRAEGTLAKPTALLANDNIMAMQGRGYGLTGFSTASRAFMKFFAAENWSDTAQGTYISLATTAKTTAAAVERLRILDNGNVGIGTLTPASLLTVAGAIQSTTGYVFPDGTVQTTATLPGVHSVTAGDTSVTVAGTAVAPTVAVNTATIQARVTGTCPVGSAVTGVTQAGNVNCGTIGASGTLAIVPVVVAQTTLSGSYGLSATKTTIFTPTTSGFYRVTVYMNSPTLGTCAAAPCLGEQITLQWNDGVSNTSLTTTTCSLVAPCSSSVATPIWVGAGQPISAYGQTWDSGTATAPVGGTYNAYVLVEQL